MSVTTPAATASAIRPSPSPSALATTERLHALDAVRGGALLLGIVFHATMSFLVGDEPMWLIVDERPSLTLTVVFFVLHIFRMTTFFLIAGFFAHLLFHRRGEGAFVRDRLRRIGVPLVVGWPILLASLVGCMIWGAWVMNGGELPPPPPPDPDAPPLAFPMTHLWFLYVLLWFYLATLLARRVVERIDAAGELRARLDRLVVLIVGHPLGVLALAIPSFCGLIALSSWRPWFGIPTPDQSLLPNVGALCAFGSAFAFGWFLHRQVGMLVVLERRWPWHFALALAATIACLAQLGVAADIELVGRDGGTVGYAASYALAVWCWTLAIIGAALRYLANYSPVRRYLADASYWLYLVHLPIVVALQIVVSQWAWPWPIKFALILGVAFPIMLLTYRFWVRNTFIGAVLNGRRYPPLRGAAPRRDAERREGTT